MIESCPLHCKPRLFSPSWHQQQILSPMIPIVDYLVRWVDGGRGHAHVATILCIPADLDIRGWVPILYPKPLHILVCLKRIQDILAL